MPYNIQLKLHTHFTKSLKRDNIYKLCLWMLEENKKLERSCRRSRGYHRLDSPRHKGLPRSNMNLNDLNECNKIVSNSI